MSDSITKYEGEAVDVSWDGRLCIHVGECGRAKGELFVGGRKPWCEPDVAGEEDVAEVVERCPTGALTYLRKKGGPGEEADEQNVVVLANNGPLYLRGELAIDGAADDMGGVGFRAALCRCGQSKKKPFCDNSHEAAGFVDRGAVGDAGPDYEGEGGPLTVKRIPNGPLMVTGKFSIVTAAGRLAWRGEKAALCRCGQSSNRPFCDGSHKAGGFTAE